jgi:hypothetical protein
MHTLVPKDSVVVIAIANISLYCVTKRIPWTRLEKPPWMDTLSLTSATAPAGAACDIDNARPCFDDRVDSAAPVW